VGGTVCTAAGYARRPAGPPTRGPPRCAATRPPPGTARLQHPSRPADTRNMARRASGLRLFGWYVLASAIPISLLGLGLAHQSQTQMNRRALDQAASEADAIANAGIEPVLGSRELAKPLTHAERMKLATTTGPLLQSGSVLRLRLRDLKGAVVFD